LEQIWFWSTVTTNLVIPRLETNKQGPTSNFNNADTVDFANVFVARETDSAATINAKLSSGLHVILCPGNYNLQDSIRITRANTVVLGIGFPTLIAANGQPAILVSNVDGVRVGGILLQAGQPKTSSLLQWGTGGYAGSASNPGFLYDTFARVGGTNNPAQYQVQADIMVLIQSGYVVLDNAWLWRADHDISGLVYNSNNPCLHGLVVNGDNVKAYGLAVEHQLQDLVVWNGNNGQTHFFQAELPYDVTQANFGTPGYVGYRVGNNVTSHSAYGAGVYCFFRDNYVTTTNGIVAPGSALFHNSLTVFLSGMGQITHTINGQGSTVTKSGDQAYVC